MEKNTLMECCCCQKELELKDGMYISATPSGKCRDGTNAERRFVCKECNHLTEE